jgi:hypothetical protein
MPQKYDESSDEIASRSPDRSGRIGARGRRVTAVALLALVGLGLLTTATGHGPSLLAAGDEAPTSAPATTGPGFTPAGPRPLASPAAPSSTPFLGELGRSGPPAVDFAVGTVIHTGGAQVGLPPDWRVRALWTTHQGWLVAADDDTGETVLALVDRSGGIQRVGGDALMPSGRWAATVNPSGTRVAWARSSGPRRFELLVADLTTGEPDFSMPLPFTPLFHDWVRGRGPLVSPNLDPDGGPLVVDLRRRELRPVVHAAQGPQPGFIGYSPRSDHLVLSRVLHAEFDDTCRPLPASLLPVRRLTCLPLGGQAAFSTDRPGHERLAVSSLGSIDVRLPDGGERRVFRGPGSAYVEQLVWEDRRSFLAVLVVTRTGATLVLRCTVDGGCRRALNASPSQPVVLARS